MDTVKRVLRSGYAVQEHIDHFRNATTFEVLPMPRIASYSLVSGAPEQLQIDLARKNRSGHFWTKLC
jgi:hypothetical protein